MAPLYVFHIILFFSGQALIVGGGVQCETSLSKCIKTSSVLTLLPGAPVWTPLAPLPHYLRLAKASIVGGRLRVAGGNAPRNSFYNPDDIQVSEVMIWLRMMK